MSIESWLVDRCTVSRMLDTRDGHGDKQFAPQEVIACRHERGSQKVRDGDGDETISTDQLATVIAIGANDRVWLPGTDTSDPRKARTPVGVDSARSKDGVRLSLKMTFF